MASPLLALLLLGIACTHAPPETRPRYEGHVESIGETIERYAEIAQTVVRVSDTEPPPPGFTRRQGAAILLGMAIGESGLARDADVGPCYRGANGTNKRCDSGRSVSMWQVWAPVPFEWRGEMVDQERLFNDRELAARIAYQRIRVSLTACAKLAPAYRLSMYGSGECYEMEGAAVRWAFIQKLLAAVRL